jgi:hypothetical protein
VRTAYGVVERYCGNILDAELEAAH